jgi:hypothetical protein
VCIIEVHIYIYSFIYVHSKDRWGKEGKIQDKDIQGSRNKEGNKEGTKGKARNETRKDNNGRTTPEGQERKDKNGKTRTDGNEV